MAAPTAQVIYQQLLRKEHSVRMAQEQQVNPIKQDYVNGLTYRAIAEKYMIDARTARRYVELNLPMSDLEQRPFTSVLDPYKGRIDSWLSKERCYASVIYEWLALEGCRCGYGIVNRYVQEKIREYAKAGRYKEPGKKSRQLPGPASITIKSEEEKSHVINRKK
jgi:hypothetical protein